MGMSLKILAVWAVITLVAFGVATGDAGSIWPLMIWLAISFVGYITSLRLHPRRACWTCGGSGRHTGLIFDYAHRACENCEGSGRRPRLGARIFNIPTD
jgi:DnaJ-class molecular chaperone